MWWMLIWLLPLTTNISNTAVKKWFGKYTCCQCNVARYPVETTGSHCAKNSYSTKLFLKVYSYRKRSKFSPCIIHAYLTVGSIVFIPPQKADILCISYPCLCVCVAAQPLTDLRTHQRLRFSVIFLQSVSFVLVCLYVYEAVSWSLGIPSNSSEVETFSACTDMPLCQFGWICIYLCLYIDFVYNYLLKIYLVFCLNTKCWFYISICVSSKQKKI